MLQQSLRNLNMIQIKYTKEYNGIEFSDAIYLTEDEFNSFTEQDIEAIKEQRFQKWIEVITKIPTQEEIDQMLLEQMEIDNG